MAPNTGFPSSALLQDKVAIIIRTTGERTDRACWKLAANEVGESALIAVDERPFWRAVRATFEEGLAAARPWTLALDADILLRPGAIKKLVSLAEAKTATLFGIEGRILDKPFGGRRPGGPKLYCTRQLSTALRFVESGAKTERPESHVKQAMAAIAIPFLEVDCLMGVHDYEQYYKDLYRKAFVHSRKFHGTMKPLRSYWNRMRAFDNDFSALLAGLDDGERFKGEVLIDVDAFPSHVSDVLNRQGIEEKEIFDPSFVDQEFVESCISRHETPSEFYRWEKLQQRRIARRCRAARKRQKLSYSTRFRRLVAPWIPEKLRKALKKLLSFTARHLSHR